MKSLPLARAVFPLAGNLAYGARRSGTHIHRGTDFPRPLGTVVHAVADGRVEHAAADWEPGFSGYGGHVVIAHADGTRALYAHLDTVSTSKGKSVFAGEQIGTVGDSVGTKEQPDKRSGGAHLHIEISPRPYPQPSEAPRIDPAQWVGAALAPRIAQAIAVAARSTGVDVALLRALAWVESKWNPDAEGKRGVGLFGLTESQAVHLGVDPRNPELAATAAALLLRQGLRRFDSAASAIASFVWGVTNVDEKPEASQWPAAVEMYVAEVLGRWNDERRAMEGIARVPLAEAGASGSRS